ncbi:MAG: hypothetical protein JWO38_4398 [Gemmataceae bacterium]|nr:hypothetical protein [Gemmataceae bacterium]
MPDYTCGSQSAAISADLVDSWSVRRSRMNRQSQAGNPGNEWAEVVATGTSPGRLIAGQGSGPDGEPLAAPPRRCPRRNGGGGARWNGFDPTPSDAARVLDNFVTIAAAPTHPHSCGCAAWPLPGRVRGLNPGAIAIRLIRFFHAISPQTHAPWIRPRRRLTGIVAAPSPCESRWPPDGPRSYPGYAREATRRTGRTMSARDGQSGRMFHYGRGPHRIGSSFVAAHRVRREHSHPSDVVPPALIGYL